MKKFCFVVALSLSFISGGCPARSLQQLFAEKDLVFNPSLIGTWSADEETYTFQQSTEKQYTLIIRSTTSKDSSMYTVQLGKIGALWFLDSYPFANSEEHHYLSVHIFTRMKLQGDTLRLASLEGDWLSTMIDKGSIKISHVKREGEIILTASTKELQKFILAAGDNNDAFPNENALVRLER